MDITQVTADLIAEQDALDAIVSGFTDEQWSTPTSSDRWSVADQIGHLAYFDGTAALAITDAEGFAEEKARLFASPPSPPDDPDQATLGAFRTMTPAELTAAWRDNRRLLADAAHTLGNKTRVPWYGPSMGSKSFLTARLMEAWAHGQHVCDATGSSREATDRIRHIAQLGVITRNWTYINRGLEPPTDELFVSLQAPSGEEWTWGDPDSAARVSGPAEDFCLVVTQCRHHSATALKAEGDSAAEWLGMAQAFAGQPTDGPKP